MKIEKGVKAEIQTTVKVEDIGERTVRFTISKEIVDRDGDIVRANGGDFTNYIKNPVFLPFHNSREFPLGKTVRIWVEGNSVKADVYFPTVEELSSDPQYASEKAKLVDFTYHAYKTGLMNAVSIGFIALEWTETKTGFDITKWELLEFSAVAIPANQEAIVEAVKSFGLDESVVKDFLTTEKSGKRISAQTKEILDKIKSCGDEIEKCRENLKNIIKTMTELLAELDDVDEPEDEPDDEPDDEPEDEPEDEKTFELPESANTIELPDLK